MRLYFIYFPLTCGIRKSVYYDLFSAAFSLKTPHTWLFSGYGLTEQSTTLILCAGPMQVWPFFTCRLPISTRKRCCDLSLTFCFRIALKMVVFSLNLKLELWKTTEQQLLYKELVRSCGSCNFSINVTKSSSALVLIADPVETDHDALNQCRRAFFF